MNLTPWYVYMVRCADDTLYTGITNHLERRIATHNRGCGAKYTRCRLPVTLIYQETLSSHGEALRREYALKRLTHAQKLHLAESYAGS